MAYHFVHEYGKKGNAGGALLVRDVQPNVTSLSRVRTPQQPKLLDRVRQAIRARHYSSSTDIASFLRDAFVGSRI